MHFRPLESFEYRMITRTIRAFISGLIERNDLLRTLVVLINDHLLPGNEIESGGMYTCVKDPAKKGTRGKED